MRSKIIDLIGKMNVINPRIILKYGLMVMIIICLIAGGYVIAKKEVMLVVDGQIQPVETFAFTVGSFVEKEGIELKEGDRIDPPPSTIVREGQKIEITRAFPVTVIADGQTTEVRVVEPSVEKVLTLAGISLNELDRVESYFDSEKKGSYVKVIRVTQEKEIREIPIDFTVKMIPDENMFRGERKEIQEGVNGLKRVTLEVAYENGKKVKEEVVDTEIVRKPVEQVILFGTKKRWEPADRHKPGSPAFEALDVMTVEATAYTHTGNTTCTGIWPYEGIVAVDPKVIPLGSKLYVEGYGYAEAQDTGGLIKGNIIDVFMDSKEKALDWGRRKVKVYILELPGK